MTRYLLLLLLVPFWSVAGNSCDKSFNPVDVKSYLREVIPAELHEFYQRDLAGFEKELPKLHPKFFYYYSLRLLHEGKPEDAHFWYYVGEIRYSLYLFVNRHLMRSRSFVLREQMRKEINFIYEFHQIESSDAVYPSVEKALKWDELNQNEFLSKEAHKAQWLEVRKKVKRVKADDLAWESL